MASDVVRTKELPVVDQYTDVSLDDRVVASHIIEGEERETVAITVGALGEKFLSEANTSTLFPRNYFGTTPPSDDFGNNGDLYFMVSNNMIDTGYYKMNDSWKPFKLGDGWDGFLSGSAFDLVSNALTIDNTAIKNVFQYSTLLRKVVMPKCKTVPANTFRNSSIRTLNMPEVETIGDNAFHSTSQWDENTPNTRIKLPKLKTIGSNSFNRMRISDGSPVYMDISNVETIGTGAFYEGTSPRFTEYEESDNRHFDLNFPKCKNIGSDAFGAYYSQFSRVVNDIILEKIEVMGSSAFRRCQFLYATSSSHSKIIFGEHINTIGTTIFIDAQSTGSRGEDPLYPGTYIYGANIDMYIRAVTPPTLDGCFDYKVINLPGGGTTSVRNIIPNIYVPEGSINAYKSATIWSIYADYIQAIPAEGIPDYD